MKVAGQVHPFVLLPGAPDEPLLLTRDQKDELHCVSNVCTHRGTLAVEGAGYEQQLRCRYHGWHFGLDGSFHSMPEFDGTANIPSPSEDLPRVALGTWTRFLNERDQVQLPTGDPRHRSGRRDPVRHHGEFNSKSTIIVIKRSMKPGFAGIDNDLYPDPKTAMLFGDAKEAVGKVVQEPKKAA